jgi:hypothetical protein
MCWRRICGVAIVNQLSSWLRSGAGKSRKGKAQLRYEQQTSGRGTFVPLVFAPGEAFQFDWSEVWAVIAGEWVKLQAAHSKLPNSKAFIVRACHRRLLQQGGRMARRIPDEASACHF